MLLVALKQRPALNRGAFSVTDEIRRQAIRISGLIICDHTEERPKAERLNAVSDREVDGTGQAELLFRQLQPI